MIYLVWKHLEAPAVDSEFGNDNINENVVTGNDNDDDNDVNDDDDNEATTMSGDNKDEDYEGEDSVSDNDNTNFTTNPIDRDPAWMLLLAVANDDDKDDPGDYNDFVPTMISTMTVYLTMTTLIMKKDMYV